MVERSVMSDDGLQAVGQEVRRLRTLAGLSGVELARRAGVPQPTVSRVEMGRRVADAEVIVALFSVLGLEGAELERWTALAREAYAATAGRRVDAGVSFRPGSAARLAQSAAAVRSFESVVIPDLLRTTGYAAAAKPLASRDELDRAAVLADEGRRFTFVVTEGALRTWPGSGECMPEQLAHLLSLVDASAVRLGVVPTSVSMSSERWGVPLHGFTVYDDAAVTVETFTRELTLTHEEEVAAYAEIFEEFARAAVFGEGAHEVVQRVRGDYEKLHSIH